MSDFAHHNGIVLASIRDPGRPTKRVILPQENAIRKSAGDDQINRYEGNAPATIQEKELFDSVRSLRHQKAFELPDLKKTMPDPPVLPGDA